jgi:hypothetical protein
MKPRLIAPGMLASLWPLGLPTWVVENCLQVVNLDVLTVLAHIDNTGPAIRGAVERFRLRRCFGCTSRVD